MSKNYGKHISDPASRCGHDRHCGGAGAWRGCLLKTTEEDLKGDGVGPSASSVKQNKAMMHRVIFQAVAILIVVVLLASSRG